MTINSKNNSVALSWEGGGAKGAFGVGVIKAFYEEFKDKVWFEAVAGSSVGGLNGVLVAAKEIEKLVKIWQTITEKDVYRLNLVPLILDGSFYTTEPLQKLLDKVLTKDLFEKIKNKKIFITGLRFETNEFLVYSEFKSRQDLLHALYSTAALPVAFKSRADGNGCQLVDGGLRYPLPLKPLLDQGYKKIVAIVHEPLDLEDWTGVPKEITTKPIHSLVEFMNRLAELVTRNLAYKDIEKALLGKIFREKLKEIKTAILVKNHNLIAEKEITEIFDQIYFPYDSEIVIISPPKDLNYVLDFSKPSIEKAMDLGYKIGKEKIPEVKKLFGFEK